MRVCEGWCENVNVIYYFLFGKYLEDFAIYLENVISKMEELKKEVKFQLRT